MTGTKDPRGLIREFGDRLRSLVPAQALYIGGSVATDDYRPGISDIDLVAVTTRAAGQESVGLVRRLHRALQAEHHDAIALGCTYVTERAVADVAVEHLTWSHGVAFHRPLSGVARAELLARGQVVFGPPVSELIPFVTPVALRAAVLWELNGYWSGALRQRSLWLRDDHVDLALLTMARADTTLRDGTLITKSEALDRLGDIGVPNDLVDEVRARRSGRHVQVGPHRRLRRAATARAITAELIAKQ